MNKKNKIIVIIIAVITILALGGLTYAFFVAGAVAGNSSTNTIVTLAADYGTITITYDGSNGTISVANMDLKESEKGTHKEYLMKFNIASTATITHNISINWSNVTNTFCQYQKNGNCTGLNTDTYVGDELNYSLYECTQSAYGSVTLSNIKTTCAIAGNPYRNAPLTGETTALQNSDNGIILMG